jgi:hypothetical protein
VADSAVKVAVLLSPFCNQRVRGVLEQIAWNRVMRAKRIKEGELSMRLTKEAGILMGASV